MAPQVPIVVTDPEYRKAAAVFDATAEFSVSVAAPAENAVAEAVRAAGARAVVLGVERYEAALYDALPAGGVLARFGVGYDGVDLAKATAAGLVATNTPGVLEQAVAEHTIALLLAIAKRLRAHVESMGRGEWAPLLGWELRGRTLAVLGCGAIGRRVGRIAAHGFGMSVVGQDIDLGAADELRDEWGFAEVLEDPLAAVSGADVISVHLPANDSTRGAVGAKLFAAARPGAVLLNTARGPVVDDAALYAALASGDLAAAGLDVFGEEPYVPVSPTCDLRRLPNVVLTPHVSSSTREACERMARAALENIRRVLAGEGAAASVLNPEALANG